MNLYHNYVYKSLSSNLFSSLCRAGVMIVAKVPQLIWGLVLIGSFYCGHGYSIPKIKIIQFPTLKTTDTTLEVQKMIEISNKVLTT